MAHDADGTDVSRRRFITASGLAGFAAIAGCTQSGGGSGGSSGGSSGGAGGSGDMLSGEILIAGSSTVFPLATQMKEEFQELHPGVNISIQSTGSGGGFANHFCPGRTDFNNASRPIKQEEIDQCAGNNVEPVELQVATDALTVVVNPDNDWADCLTVEELRGIWRGDDAPAMWSDLDPDWPDEEFVLLGPTEASGTYDYFNEVILEDGEIPHRQDYQATEQDRTIVTGVANDEYAMGYLGFAYYTENSDAVKAVAIDDGNGCVEPSLETAKGGQYTPLSRPLFTYPKKSALAEDHIREFAKFWIDNTDNQEIVAEEVGYVPLDATQKAAQVEKLQAAIDEVL